MCSGIAHHLFWGVVIAFRDSVVHGLLSLFVPYYILIYLFVHWERAGSLTAAWCKFCWIFQSLWVWYFCFHFVDFLEQSQYRDNKKPRLVNWTRLLNERLKRRLQSNDYALPC